MLDSTLTHALTFDAGEDRRHFLYRTAAIAALISVALFLFQIAAFFGHRLPPALVVSLYCTRVRSWVWSALTL